MAAFAQTPGRLVMSTLTLRHRGSPYNFIKDFLKVEIDFWPLCPFSFCTNPSAHFPHFFVAIPSQISFEARFHGTITRDPRFSPHIDLWHCRRLYLRKTEVQLFSYNPFLSLVFWLFDVGRGDFVWRVQMVTWSFLWFQYDFFKDMGL